MIYYFHSFPDVLLRADEIVCVTDEMLAREDKTRPLIFSL